MKMAQPRRRCGGEVIRVKPASPRTFFWPNSIWPRPRGACWLCAGLKSLVVLAHNVTIVSLELSARLSAQRNFSGYSKMQSRRSPKAQTRDTGRCLAVQSPTACHSINAALLASPIIEALCFACGASGINPCGRDDLQPLTWTNWDHGLTTSHSRAECLRLGGNSNVPRIYPYAGDSLWPDMQPIDCSGTGGRTTRPG